jgi:outer membrane lipoprotein
MRASPCRALQILLAFALPALVVACAPAPIYKVAPHHVTATPAQVAASPAAFGNQQVIWGGRVVSVHNLADHSEVEVLAYPLDSSQRPRLKQPATGRFIAVVPDFVDPMNYPADSPVTLRGTLAGARTGTVGQSAYTFALVRSNAMHRWTPEEMRKGHPKINIGIGIGGWIH